MTTCLSLLFWFSAGIYLLFFFLLSLLFSLQKNKKHNLGSFTRCGRGEGKKAITSAMITPFSADKWRQTGTTWPEQLWDIITLSAWSPSRRFCPAPLCPQPAFWNLKLAVNAQLRPTEGNKSIVFQTEEQPETRKRVWTRRKAETENKQSSREAEIRVKVSAGFNGMPSICICVCPRGPH